MQVIRDMGARLGIAGELLGFLWAQKLFWLAPIVIVLLIMGLIIVFASTSGIGPFVTHFSDEKTLCHGSQDNCRTLTSKSVRGTSELECVTAPIGGKKGLADPIENIILYRRYTCGFCWEHR